MNHNSHVVEIRQSSEFEKWLKPLQDKHKAARFQIRIDRLELGLFGDVNPVGGGISELRIGRGPDTASTLSDAAVS